MLHTDKANESKFSWVLKLIVLCIAIFILKSSLSNSTPFYFPASLGENSVYSIVLWFIFKKNFLQESDSISTKVSFILILLTFMFSSFITGIRYENDMKVGTINLEKNISSVMESLAEGTQLPTENIEPTTFKQTNTTSKKLLNWTNDLIISTTNARNKYLKQLDESGLGDLINPVRLKQDKNLTESYSILKNIEMYLKQYEDNSFNLRAEHLANLKSLSLKQPEMKLINDGFSRGTDLAISMMNIEKDVLKEFTHIIDLLAKTPKVYSIESEQLYFTSDEYVETYNNHLMNIQSLAKQQERLQKETAEKYKASQNAT